MERVISGTDMKLVDRYTIEEIKIPSLVLMERAAYEIYVGIKNLINHDHNIIIVCGVGNNGADGLALARILITEDIKANIAIMVLGDEDNATDEFKLQREILFDKLKCDKISVSDCAERSDIFEHYDIIIDAIFGIGLKRDVKGKYAAVIDSINTARKNKGVYTVSIDAPSGIDTDTGAVMGTAVNADMTVTFGVNKKGLILYPGAEYAGKVIVKNIGFPQDSFDRGFQYGFYYTKTDLRRIPERCSYSNKGTYGKILVIAGSKDMCGAAYMSAKSAFRTGAGLVKIFTVDENKETLQKMLPEAIISTYNKDNPDMETYKSQLDFADVIIIGPGMGTGSYQCDLVREVLNTKKPVVVDADALNNISLNDDLRMFYHEKCIITPHVGEMSRLTHIPVNGIKTDLQRTAEEYAAENGIVCVLKDARTVISDRNKNIYFNMSGNNGMATAGSGDVLTGIIAGLAAAGADIYEAACLGTYIHGLAGDTAAEKKGAHSMMATDIIDEIENVIKSRCDYNE